MSERRVARRALVLGLAGSAAFAGLARAEAAKVTKASVSYQDGPKGIQMCATCTLFVAPKSCKVVEGEVSPKGWCSLYDLAD